MKINFRLRSGRFLAAIAMMAFLAGSVNAAVVISSAQDTAVENGVVLPDGATPTPEPEVPADSPSDQPVAAEAGHDQTVYQDGCGCGQPIYQPTDCGCGGTSYPMPALQSRSYAPRNIIRRPSCLQNLGRSRGGCCNSSCH